MISTGFYILTFFDPRSQNLNEKPSRALALAKFPKGSLQICYQKLVRKFTDFDPRSQNLNEKPSRALALAAFPKGSLQACYHKTGSQIHGF